MVTRVWGKADNFDIVLAENNGVWSVSIPPDLSDGQYVIELCAEADNFLTDYYTAILNMVDGRLTNIQLKPIRYKVKLLDGNVYLRVLSDTFELNNTLYKPFRLGMLCDRFDMKLLVK